jgi:hypothetical protein
VPKNNFYKQLILMTILYFSAFYKAAIVVLACKNCRLISWKIEIHVFEWAGSARHTLREICLPNLSSL